PKPVSVRVETFGTAKLGISDEKITQAVQEVFSFKPADIVTQLDLLRPIYRQTTNYGHFGKDGLPWESTHKAAALQKAVGL
ncbi:MAG TPA: methionine adenosyltransferase domain-containing protein, partial [Opitutaceae bacterium]